MEEKSKEKNEKADTGIQNEDKIEELDKNIYKEPQNDQASNIGVNFEEKNKITFQENQEKINEEKKEEEKDIQNNNNINNNTLNEKELNKDDLMKEIEKIKKEKESLEEQNKSLEEKNTKLNEENIKLSSKLKSLKENIIKLKECLEKDIYTKLDSKTKMLKDVLIEKDSLSKQNQLLNEEIKKYKLNEEEFQKYRDKFDSLMREKTAKDNLSLKQTEKIKIFQEEIEMLNKQSSEKDEKYKKLDEIYLGVIKVIEEHKKTIQNLKNKIKAKEVEDNNKKIIIYQKEQEITLLRSFINSYKGDIKMRLKNRMFNNYNSNYNNNYNIDNLYIKKDFTKLKKNKSEIDLIVNKKLDQKFNKDNNRNQNLPKIDSKTNTNDNYNILKKKVKMDLNDDEDGENIKDITNMMKKMINE